MNEDDRGMDFESGDTNANDDQLADEHAGDTSASEEDAHHPEDQDNAPVAVPDHGDQNVTLGLADAADAVAPAPDAEATAAYDDDLFGTVFTPPPDAELTASHARNAAAHAPGQRRSVPSVYCCIVGNHVVFIEQITFFMNGMAMCPRHPQVMLILQPADTPSDTPPEAETKER